MGLIAQSLRHRVTIQSRTEGQDDLGQPLLTWTDLATVWADVRHPGGLESIKADAIVSTVRASIRIRYRTDITAAMRVLHAGRVYEIKAVLPDDTTRQTVDLACEVTQ